MLLLVRVVCICLAASPCFAFQQEPGHFGGFISDGSVITVADDFQFASDTRITGVSWWGGYFNSLDVPDQFTLTFFNDDGGKPGSSLATIMPAPVIREATGGIVGAEGRTEFRYSTAFPFVANANERYWLAIANPPRDYWIWEASRDSRSPGVMRTMSGLQGAAWQPYFDDAAFELHVVPEPSSLALMILGLPIFALLRSRFRF